MLVGYAALLWPKFEAVGKYILRAGASAETIESFENRTDSSPKAVEWVLNHEYLFAFHTHDQLNLTADKLIFLGQQMKEIHEAKLAWQFPDRPCAVEFYVPDDPLDFVEYQISFWQKAWES